MASMTLPGETESGDRHLVKIESNLVVAAAVDGLGHGDEAAAAAQAAIQTLEGAPVTSVIALLNRCHERLRSTRGVAMSVALYNETYGTMTWAGVGNVEGVLLRANPDANPRYKSLFLHSGTVGVRLPQMGTATVRIMAGDTLVFATDGIHGGFAEKLSALGPPKQIADRILTRYKKGNDDALVLVVRYLGGAP